MSARVAPDVVVLDVGEVIIDESRVWTVWAGLLGVSPATLMAVLGAAVSQGGDHHDAFPHVAPNVDWTALEDEHEARYGGFAPEDVYADVVPALTALRAAGRRVVLAGNQPARRTQQLHALDLPVDDVVVSEELGAEKPDPAFYSALMGRLGIEDPARVLYVGDRVDNDVLPAAEAGMAVCWLTRGPWGQLQEAPEDVEPDMVLEGLGELPELLAAWHDGTLDDAQGGAPDGASGDGRDGR